MARSLSTGTSLRGWSLGLSVSGTGDSVEGCSARLCPIIARTVQETPLILKYRPDELPHSYYDGQRKNLIPYLALLPSGTSLLERGILYVADPLPPQDAKGSFFQNRCGDVGNEHKVLRALAWPLTSFHPSCAASKDRE